MLARLSLILALLLAIASGAAAQRFDLPPVPRDAPVGDFAGVLSPSERMALARKIMVFGDSSTAQIGVAIVPTVNGADMNQYATELGRAWGVGTAEDDNGVVLLVAIQDREIYIATGYGAEGALPDALAGRIIREVISPYFRQGQFYAGLDQGTDAIIAALRGEYTRDTSNQPVASGEGMESALFLILLIFIVFVVLSSKSRGRPGPPPGGGGGGRRRRSPGVIFIPGGGYSGGFGGGFGGGGSGLGGLLGGGGGGFGGGGFGGFGGGGFGGGGAGGGW